MVNSLKGITIDYEPFTINSFMARIAGVDLPNNKRVDIALTYIYGIGRKNVKDIIQNANLDPAKRVHALTDEEINRLSKIIEKGYIVEGDLRRQVFNNIKQLKDIGAYRGFRHIRNLPARGQRTRSNARTKRGKRVTIGAMKKEDRVKLEAVKPAEKK